MNAASRTLVTRKELSESPSGDVTRYLRKSFVAGRKSVTRDQAAADGATLSDSDGKIFDFVLSTATRDRYGDTIAVPGWQCGNFLAGGNGPVAWSHDYLIPPIGRSPAIAITQKALVGRAIFSTREFYPLSGLVADLYETGALKAVSVGFDPLEFNGNFGTGFEFEKQELLEFSAVVVPANPEALIMAQRKGLDLSPMDEWARKALDLSGKHVVERDKLEAVVKALGYGRGVKFFDLSPKEIREKVKAHTKDTQWLPGVVSTDDDPGDAQEEASEGATNDIDVEVTVNVGVMASGGPDDDEEDEPEDEPMQCPECNGSGDCSMCHGTGQVSGMDCAACNGSGKCPMCSGTGDMPMKAAHDPKTRAKCGMCNGSGKCKGCAGSGEKSAAGHLVETKGVVAYQEHSKAPDGESWDGPSEVAAASVDDLKVMCTWYADDGSRKGDYKLPHHKANGYAVVWKGVANAAARLPQTDLPSGDVAGCESHLGKHYKQFGKTPPWEKDAKSWRYASHAIRSAVKVRGAALDDPLLAATLRAFGFDEEAEALIASEKIYTFTVPKAERRFALPSEKEFETAVRKAFGSEFEALAKQITAVTGRVVTVPRA